MAELQPWRRWASKSMMTKTEGNGLEGESTVYKSARREREVGEEHRVEEVERTRRHPQVFVREKKRMEGKRSRVLAPSNSAWPRGSITQDREVR